MVIHQGAVLLVKRARAPSEGLWAVPGGKIELGETLQDAAEREVLEETGIRVRAGEAIYCFDTIERDQHGAIVFHYVIVDLVAEYVSGEPRAGDDALEAAWISPRAMDRLRVSEKTRYLLRSRFGF